MPSRSGSSSRAKVTRRYGARAAARLTDVHVFGGDAVAASSAVAVVGGGAPLSMCFRLLASLSR